MSRDPRVHDSVTESGPAVASSETPDTVASGTHANRPRRWWVTRVGLPVAAGVSLVGLGVAASGSGADESTSTVATTTAVVEKRTITERETFDGRLGYDDARTLVNLRTGTLTRTADEGATVKRGGVLYRVDNEPVYLLYGATPVYRTMQQGDEGPDISQLESELMALGYDDDGQMDVDGDFDGDTADAVRDWQSDKGLSESGRIELGQVAFLAGARRVTAVRVERGGSVRPGQPLLDTTSTKRSVTVDLDARRQDLVKVGAKEKVTLTDGSKVDATITEIGAVAKAAKPGDDPTVEVTLVLSDASKAPGLDSAPVDVEITKDTAKDVLSVPVTALLALADGGYGVETQDADGNRQVVAVETGLFSDGFVEIKGSTVPEGTSVVVPA